MMKCKLDKQRGGQQIDRQHGGVRAAGGEPGQRQQAQAQNRSGDQQRAAGRSQWWLDGSRIAAGRLGPAEQAPGAPDQHHGHHQKFSHQRELGKTEVDAQPVDGADADTHRLDLGNQQRGHKGTRDRPHAAHHHHHKRVADGQQVEVERGRLTRQLQRAAQAGQQRTQRKHAGKQPRLVDAQRADHLTVLRGGAHQRAPAGAGEQQPQGAQHHRADDDQQQVVAGEPPAQDVHRPAQARCTGAEQILRAPQPQRGVLDHQHQGKGGQQLEQLRRAVDAAQQQHLDCRADDAHGQCRQHQRRPETQHRPQPLDRAVGDVDPQHEKRAVREVDDAGDAKDQRQPRRHQKQRRRAGQAVEQLD